MAITYNDLYLDIRRQLRAALLAADFTPPSITNATDDLSQHYVYEFEDVGGLADG